MKKTYLFLTSLFLFPLFSGAAEYPISTVGSTFTPDTIVIQVGDDILWNVTASHPVREVSESTYLANGDASNGGFEATDQQTTNFAATGNYYYVCQNHFSSGMKGLIIVEDSTTGIETTSQSSFSMYPNPATTLLHLENVKNSNVVIYDVLGKAVLSKSIANDSYQLSLQSWDKGVYFISIRKGTAVLSKRLIIE